MKWGHEFQNLLYPGKKILVDQIWLKNPHMKQVLKENKYFTTAETHNKTSLADRIFIYLLLVFFSSSRTEM